MHYFCNTPWFIKYTCLAQSIRFNSQFHTTFIHRELKQCFDELSNDPDCRAIVLSGAGKLFSAGLDLKDAMIMAQDIAKMEDPARKGQLLENKIRSYQVRDLKTLEKRFNQSLNHFVCIHRYIRMRSLHWSNAQSQ